MNLGMQLKWANHILAILREPPPSMMQSVSTARLNEKLGWIEAFAADVSAWSQWQQVVDVTVALVSEQGLYRGVSRLLVKQLPQGKTLCHSARVLAAELIRFVRSQECRTRTGERFPGSTEILESCFGKFKSRRAGRKTAIARRIHPIVTGLRRVTDTGNNRHRKASHADQPHR